jgi:hypothetical protein
LGESAVAKRFSAARQIAGVSFRYATLVHWSRIPKRCGVTHGQSRLDVISDLEWSSGLRLIFQPLLIQCEALL